MSGDFNICIGTIGMGIWHSSNGGAGWRRGKLDLPFHAQPGEIQVRALTVSPHHERQLYAGSEVGLHRSDDAGASWQFVKSPMEGSQIWSIAVHPRRPGVVLVGTKPPALYRTEDGGASWDRLPIDIAKECFAGPPKVTQIVFDPRDPDTIWVGVEVDGVQRSRDGGKTWERLPALGGDPIHQDVHGLSVAPGPQPTIRATTPDGIWSSTDEGQSWQLFRFPRFFERSGISYCRGHALKADDPEVIFVGNGDFVPGKIGAIQQTRDGGRTWAAAALPRTPNSTVYSFATHPADPDLVVAHSLFGNVYTTGDAGRTWQVVEREFGEIRSIAWLPE